MKMKKSRGYLNALPSGCDGIDVSKIVENTLRRDPNAFALERGVGVTGRLRGSLADLSSGRAGQDPARPPPRSLYSSR